MKKVDVLKEQACGFGDWEYFKLRIYHLYTQRNHIFQSKNGRIFKYTAIFF